MLLLTLWFVVVLMNTCVCGCTVGITEWKQMTIHFHVQVKAILDILLMIYFNSAS